MSAALQDIVSMSIGILIRLHLGVGSDISQRRFQKDDVTHGGVEGWGRSTEAVRQWFSQKDKRVQGRLAEGRAIGTTTKPPYRS